MFYNAAFLEVTLNHGKCCENIAIHDQKAHWIQSFLRKLTSTGFNKDFQKANSFPTDIYTPKLSLARVLDVHSLLLQDIYHPPTHRNVALEFYYSSQ